MFDSKVLAFTIVAAILTATPGADTMLVIRSVLTRGRRAGLVTVLGICSGVLVHAVLSALGLSIILMRSATLFEIVKFAGAGYLVFLGSQSIWQALYASPSGLVDDFTNESATVSLSRSYLEGLLTDLLNPKMVIFYLAFLPQFINPGDPVLSKSLLLGSIHCAMGLVWLSTVALFMGHMRTFLTRPNVKRGLEGITGGVLIMFGVRLALEQR